MNNRLTPEREARILSELMPDNEAAIRAELATLRSELIAERKKPRPKLEWRDDSDDGQTIGVVGFPHADIGLWFALNSTEARAAQIASLADAGFDISRM